MLYKENNISRVEGAEERRIERLRRIKTETQRGRDHTEAWRLILQLSV